MNDTQELLVKSREYFRKFLLEKKQDFFEAMREYNVGHGTGYSYFYRSNEVVQCMRDMYHNLDETFGNLTIPGEFPSPKRLVQTWKWFKEYLDSTDELFDEVKNYLIDNFELADNENIQEYIKMGAVFPIPFSGINTYRIELKEILEYTLSLDEVKEYLLTIDDNGDKKNEQTIIEEIEEKGVYTPNNSNENIFDIAIVTAINTPELKKVKDIIQNINRLPIKSDPTIYHNGHFTKSDGSKISVVVGCDDKMGLPAASSLSMKMIYTFKPKYLVMLGICAGIKGKVNSGDILIADLVWDYGSGKHVLVKNFWGVKKRIFKPYINQIQLDVHLEGLLKSICSDKKYVSQIQSNWNSSNSQIDTPLEAKSGPFASGSAVIANENIVSEINDKHGKLLGFDMEAYGVFNAARYSPFGNTKAITIKSVSDFGDSDKNNKNKDLLQDYAAYTSAQFFLEVAINDLNY